MENQSTACPRNSAAKRKRAPVTMDMICAEYNRTALELADLLATIATSDRLTGELMSLRRQIVIALDNMGPDFLLLNSAKIMHSYYDKIMTPDEAARDDFLSKMNLMDESKKIGIRISAGTKSLIELGEHVRSLYASAAPAVKSRIYGLTCKLLEYAERYIAY
jgi:hypothetical protein